MILTGSADEIMAQIAQDAPGVDEALDRIDSRIARKPKREVERYQAAALYALAQQYDGGRILEIGTAVGYSAATMAEAAPHAAITTLNPNAAEAAIARVNLSPYPNVKVVEARSVDYLDMMQDAGAADDEQAAADALHDAAAAYLARNPNATHTEYWDMVFVDGDHARVRVDFAYWDRLAIGGLLLFHDFSPGGTWRACPPVYEACSEFAAWLGRVDVHVVDDKGVGMIGFVRRDGDPSWGGQPDQPPAQLLDLAIAGSIQPGERLAKLWRVAGAMRDVPGAIVSVGAGLGGAAALMTEAAGADGRALWLFDTWEGIPPPADVDGAKAAAKWHEGWLRFDKADALAHLELWEAVTPTLVQGDVTMTVPGLAAAIGTIAVLHIDVDWYAPTLAALDALYDQVADGGIIICDDYGHWQGTRLAVDEFRARRGITSPLMGLDYTAHWWRK
jgi:predicted O-methyltransferase YrrM